MQLQVLILERTGAGADVFQPETSYGVFDRFRIALDHQDVPGPYLCDPRETGQPSSFTDQPEDLDAALRRFSIEIANPGADDLAALWHRQFGDVVGEVEKFFR